MKYTTHLKTLFCLTASVALIGCSATRYDRSTGQFIDDNATTARVSSALGSDSIVRASDIKVDTFRGNVHLTGFVDHPVQKERASQIARNVKGVEYFKNDIVVKVEIPGAQQMSQGQISEPSGATRNSSEMRQNLSSSGAPSSKNGGWEKGTLSNYDPAGEFSSRAGSTINGTSASSANISGEPSGSANDLSQRINTQLRSDTSSSAQNVRVESTANGTITLRGIVSSEQEKRSIENRVKGIQGVSGVNNELEVRE